MRTQQTRAVTILPLTDVFFHAHVVRGTDKRLNSKGVMRESCHYLAWNKQTPFSSTPGTAVSQLQGKTE